MVQEPGTHRGERYDAVQTSIRYNHVALGPKDWGRAGSEASLRLDDNSAEAVEHFDTSTALGLYLQQQLELKNLDTQDVATKAAAKTGLPSWEFDIVLMGLAEAPRPEILRALASVLGLDLQTLAALIPQRLRRDSNSGRAPMEEIIVIAGVEFKVDKSTAQAYRQEKQRLDSQVADLSKKAEQQQARLDSIESELTAEKAARASAEDPKRFDSAVAERVALFENAKKAGLKEDEVAGKTKRQIQEAAILRLDSKAVLTGKSDDYVEARFDAMLERIPAGGEVPSHKKTQAQILGQLPNTETRADSNKSRATMLTDSQEAWKQPLAFSKA